MTDIHLKGIAPMQRRDDYVQTMYNKLEEILELGKSENIDFFICGGDVLDGAHVSYRVMDRYIDLIESYNIPFYSTEGNHEQENARQGTGALTHIFNRSTVIKHLTELNFDDLYISGMDYSIDIDETLCEEGYFVSDEHKDKWKVFCPHANVTPTKAIFSHVLAKDFDTNVDVLLISHYHSYHGIKEINDTKYCWIGALSRGTIGISDIERDPAILILDSKDKSVVEYKLKNVLPIEEVFDLDKVNEIKETKKDLKSFVDSLKDVKVQGFEFIDRLKHVCKDKDIDNVIRDIIIKEIPEGE